MCHHWLTDREESWEAEVEELHEEDPEAELEPDPVEVVPTDDD